MSNRTYSTWIWGCILSTIEIALSPRVRTDIPSTVCHPCLIRLAAISEWDSGQRDGHIYQPYPIIQGVTLS